MSIRDHGGPAPASDIRPCVLADSVTDLDRDASAGSVVACGSHGGTFAGDYATYAAVAGIVVNDAGVGRDDAGISGLALLAQRGTPAAAVSHAEARIGLARDTLAARLLHVNAVAAQLGCRPGDTARMALERMAQAPWTPSSGDMVRPQEARHLVEIGGELVRVLDSASLVEPEDAGSVIVTGSHGAPPGGSAYRALKVRARAVVFNDAGGGRNCVGWSRLPILQRQLVAAATVSAESARIGSGFSTLEDGRVSHVNETAERLGARVGMSTRAFIDCVINAKETQ